LKLGEAILEKEHLKQHLDLLEARLRDDHEKGSPLAHLREELQRTANRWRDLQIAISWTEQQVAIGGLSLGSYYIRRRVLEVLGKIMEPVDREKADEYLDAAYEDNKLIEAAIWFVDLQVPSIKAPHENSETEED
jgi:hypothetical protein